MLKLLTDKLDKKTGKDDIKGGKMKCELCGREFMTKRSDARYCSAKCRVKARRLSVTELELSVADSDLSVTNPKLSVTKPDLSVTDVTDKLSVTDEINQKLNAMKRKQQVLSRDDWDSPDYDLSEAGFIRRNENWLDDDCFPGTEESRKAFMAVVTAQRQGVRTRRRSTKAELREKLKGSCYSRLI